MITKAFILQKGTGHFHHEEGMIVQELEKRGMPYRTFSRKHILRRQLPLDRESLVVGGKDEIYGVLKQLDISIPKPDSYPLPLRPFLHRKVWSSTLGQEERNITVLDQPPTFIKPLGREKCFTGKVFSTYADFRTLNVSSWEDITKITSKIALKLANNKFLKIRKLFSVYQYSVKSLLYFSRSDV